MTPLKQHVFGIGGFRLAAGGTSYQLNDGTSTRDLAVTVSLLLAEPSLRKLYEAVAISSERAAAMGYRFVRTYDEAVAYGLV